MASGDIHVDPIWEKVRAIATFHAFTRADNIASGEGYVVETFNCRWWHYRRDPDITIWGHRNKEGVWLWDWQYYFESV